MQQPSKIEKELSEIAWNVPEATYRADPALSYSTLSRYEREGFNNLDKLFEPVTSSSLTFGSCVDSLLTGGEDEFRERFIVLDITITDSGMEIAKALADRYEFTGYDTFAEIPESYVSTIAKDVGFWKADKWDDRRYKEVIKTGNIQEYYWSLLHSDKTIVSTDTYNDVIACVNALKESPATMHCFASDDPFTNVKRYYQLKFKAKFNGVTYRCMADELIVDYDEKVIYPYDLKTSGHPEWDFQESFKTWNYVIQSRLYWRIIWANLMNDPYFKDFSLEDYQFIVINRRTLTPLVWRFPYTTFKGTLVDDKGNRFRDPFEIGEELKGYLDFRPKVPKGIDMDDPNEITCLRPE